MAGIKTLGFAVDYHDPRSWELYRFIADMDYEHGDRFCFKAGGDGDNGELLLAYLDEWYNEGVAGMTQSKWVRVGSVRRFDKIKPDKEQALKVLEEAAEVVESWKAMTSAELAHGGDCVLARLWRRRLLDECADVIQATLNLVAALGVEDFRPYLKACEERNRERGRITDGKAVDE